MPDRNSMRKEMLAVRDAMPDREQVLKSVMIMDKLWGLPAFKKAATVMFYVNFRSEVKTMDMIRKALAEDKQVAVPLTLVNEKELVPYAVTDIHEDLIAGYCGIPEPVTGKVRRIEPSAIAAVIVPGSVFDHRGGRLGYGGGYYDRFLEKKAPRALRIGICYEMQVVAEVPMQQHDQYLDWLVTEEHCLHCRHR